MIKINYHFQLRVNLSANNYSSTGQVSSLLQIPCYSKECLALIGVKKEITTKYTFKMCQDSSETCKTLNYINNITFKGTPLKSNVLLWSQYAYFQIESDPAIEFEIYKAYIYLPEYANSSEGLGVELDIQEIIIIRTRYGYLHAKYQMSSQASTVGNQVSLKFLIRKKINGRMLNPLNNIASLDISEVQVMDKIQTFNYLAEDEKFKIIWWFWLMIGIFGMLFIFNLLACCCLNLCYCFIKKNLQPENPIQVDRQ